MESKIEEDIDNNERQETPLCLNCLRPVNPLYHYCPFCGEATGRFTHYIPFVNIPWQTRIWGRMWRQLWSPDVSVPGKLFRLFMIIWNVPILLVGLIPKLWKKTQIEESKDNGQPDVDNAG
jgi:hypothetical protein